MRASQVCNIGIPQEEGEGPVELYVVMYRVRMEWSDFVDETGREYSEVVCATSPEAALKDVEKNFQASMGDLSTEAEVPADACALEFKWVSVLKTIPVLTNPEQKEKP